MHSGWLVQAAKAAGPKKARSAYIIFGSHTRPKIEEEFPGIKASEVLKLIGAKWKVRCNLFHVLRLPTEGVKSCRVC